MEDGLVPVDARATLSTRIIAGLAIVVALGWGQVVLIPLVLSALISYALEPLVSRLEAWHMPRPLAVPVVLTLLLAGGTGVAYSLRGEAAAFIERLPAGVHVVPTAIQRTT